MDKEELKVLHKIQKTASLGDLIMIRNNFNNEITKRIVIERKGVKK